MAVAGIMLDSSKAQFLCPLFIYSLVHSFICSLSNYLFCVCYVASHVSVVWALDEESLVKPVTSSGILILA